MRRAPRIGSSPASLVGDGEDTTKAICRLALALDHSTMAVQGPPGSGKTTAAARVIVELVCAGKRVGVIANSHKVIVHLLKKAIRLAKETGAELRCHHMCDEDDLDGESTDFETGKDYAKIAPAIRAGALDLVGGTAWAWSRELFAGALDALVVDEAGQMSLANVLAVSPAAKNLILFGDPAQLEQPQKGVHPPGSDCSALEHLIGGDPGATMPPDLGVFMPHTRRLHPDICRFTSAVFYEGRLEADPELARQRIVAAGPLSGSGLRFIAVEHRGNTNHSPEEVDRIGDLVEELFRGEPTYVCKEGRERTLEQKDVLIVAPYNVQVNALRERLPAYRRQIGTVDKFQGQEAPIVIYSVTASSVEDAPKGMEFLFSLNRLNVATSRAQALVVVVASPELARARCRTPKQMRLANALCGYLEGVL